LDPNDPLSAEQLAAWVRVLAAGMAGFYPEAVDGSAFFLEEWLMPQSADQQAIRALVASVVGKLHLPEWWTEGIARLRAADAREYAQARELAKSWPGARIAVALVRHVAL